MNRQIYVTSDFIGHHRWPEAPDDVAFLRNLHRHKFGVKVTVNVNHSDRAVEFFQFKRVLDAIVRIDIVAHLLSVPRSSCEDMAQLIGAALMDRVPNVSLASVEVNEDGENGAIISW